MQDLFSKSIQVLGFCLIFAFFVNYYKDRQGIEYSTHILSGAKMYTDENGIRNIIADNIEDGFFALGFAHAEDRLWQMYFAYKVANGEISEVTF